jgi:hypothetical protein
MNRRRVLACLLTAGTIATGCVIATSSSSPTNAAASRQAAGPAWLDSRVARFDAPHEITVDFTDEVAAHAFLDKNMDNLDGYTINVIGMDTVPSATRAQRDAEAWKAVPPAKDVLLKTSWSCVMEAKGASGVRAFRGCVDAHATWGAVAGASAVSSRPSQTDVAKAELASYRAAAVTLGITPVSHAGFEVALHGSHATINMTGTRSQALKEGDPGQEMVWWLTATAFSNASIDSVEFTFNGDCTAFGVATGGDTCMDTIDRRDFANSGTYGVER